MLHIGKPPLIFGQQSAGVSCEDDSGQNIDKNSNTKSMYGTAWINTPLEKNLSVDLGLET